METERLIGLFLNTLALRARLTPQLTFREAMAIVRRTVLDGLEHADVPIERIVQDLGLERSSTTQPLYETIFNFTPPAPRRLELPELHVRFEEPPALIEEFSTQLFVTEWEGALDLDLRYRRQRYSDARMECLLEQYLAILEQVARDADRTVGSLIHHRRAARGFDPAVPSDEPSHSAGDREPAEWIATPDQPAIQTDGHRDIRAARRGDDRRHETLHARHAAGRRGRHPRPRSAELVIAMAGTLLAGASC